LKTIEFIQTIVTFVNSFHVFHCNCYFDRIIIV